MPIYVPGKVTLKKEFTVQDYMWSFPQQYGLWSPAEISTALWLDAADSSTVIAASGNVSQWNDKSGNGRNFLQSTSAAQPAYTPSSLNSRAVLGFDGADSLTSNFPLALTSESIFVVTKFASSSSAFGRFFTQSDAGNDYDTTGHYIPLIRNNSTATLASFAGGIMRSQVSLAYDTWGIAGSVHTGSLITNYINATAGTDSAHTLNKTFTRFALGILLGAGTDGFLNGSIAEVIVLSSAATSITRQKIEGYLAHKWGLTANLPSDHPYKTVGPTP